MPITPVVHVDKHAFDKVQWLDFLLERFRKIVSDAQRQMLVEHNVQFDERLLANMIDHKVVEVLDAIVVLDGESHNAAKALLLHHMADN